MALTFHRLHPTFVAEVGAVDLRRVHDRATLDEIRAGMDEYAILVFRDQTFTDAEQLAFAERFDGVLHSNTGVGRAGQEPLRQRGADRHLEPGREGRDPAVRGPPPHVRARQPPLAHRRVVPGPARPLLDAVGQSDPASRCRYGVRRHARRLRRARAADQSVDRRPARAPFHCLLAADARVRVLAGGRGEAQGRGPSAGSHQPAHRRAGRCTSPRMPRASSTGRCRKDGCCCAT